MRVGRLDAEYQILPLRVVAEEGAAPGRNGAPSAEDLKIRRMRLVFNRRVLQARRDERPRRSGEIGVG